MIITVFSAKGGVGKTPISTNIAFDLGYVIGTNDEYHGFGVVERIDDDRLLVVAPGEEFPPVPNDVDVVFDLGGTLSGESAPSIRSAIKQSDLVLVPVSNETKAIISGINSIQQVREITENIVVVATKLKRASNENAAHPWSESRDFQNIKTQIEAGTGRSWSFLPLRFSAGFDALFDQEKSLRELVGEGGMHAHHFAMPAHQFEEIYETIKRYEKS